MSIDAYRLVYLDDTVFCHEYTYECWGDAKVKIADLVADDRTRIYRGQHDSNWGLSPSIERLLHNDHRSMHIEKWMCDKFKREVGCYRATSLESDFECFEIMQHYGAPTRLLDFSKSPYVAAYFAFENPVRGKGGSEYVTIWVVEGGWISSHNLHIYDHVADLLKNASYRLRRYKDYRLIDNLFNASITGMLALEPSKLDKRMLAQQSVFLAPTILTKSFESVLATYYETLNDELLPPVIKINISKHERLSVMEDLNLMNINARTMFPGLQGFIKSFNWECELALR